MSPDPLPQSRGSRLDVIQAVDNVAKSLHDKLGLGVEGSVATEISNGNIIELGEEVLVTGVLGQVPYTGKIS